jgi:hypothetical protein
LLKIRYYEIFYDFFRIFQALFCELVQSRDDHTTAEFLAHVGRLGRRWQTGAREKLHRLDGQLKTILHRFFPSKKTKPDEANHGTDGNAGEQGVEDDERLIRPLIHITVRPGLRFVTGNN